MRYEIIWSNFAESELDKIFEYYVENVSVEVAKKIINKILSEPNCVIGGSEKFQLEELLLERKEVYRYLVCDNYKIIYSVDFDLKLIKIADVFDTRQYPIKIKRTK